ncbi:MAG: DnaJ domain-containing protein [Haloferacaceae archaeon]
MDRDRLLLALAAVFAGLTVLLAVAALAVQPFLLLLAVPFGAVTYLLWSHATGRLEERARRRARTRTRTGPRDQRAAGPRGGPSTGDRDRTARATPTGPSRREAYRTLGLDPGAGQDAVERAYRERVKETHPDAGAGDEETFKRVKRAYEALDEG